MASNVKAVFGRKFASTVETWPLNDDFRGKRMGYILNYGFVTTKRTLLRRTASFDVFCVKYRAVILAVG